jgi:hypothetical protein
MIPVESSTRTLIIRNLVMDNSGAIETQTTVSAEALASVPELASSSELEGKIDFTRFRLKQNFETLGGAEKLLTTVPVRKPRKDEFVRVSPQEEHVMDVALLEYGESRDTYLLSPEVQSLGFGMPVRLVLAIDRMDNPFIWPLKIPSDEMKQSSWHLSALEASELAKQYWVRVAADMKLQAYQIYKAVGELPEPEWPNKSFGELLNIAFKNSIIESADHIVLRQLAGEV